MTAGGKLLKDLNVRMEARFAREYTEQSMTDWIIANTTLRGRPFSTKGYEFQRAIADDMHPNMDVKKCSQVGLTEIQIRKALGFVYRNAGASAIFTLPTDSLFRKVSQTRIKPIVDRDKVFNLGQDEDSVRSMSIMQFGASWLYVTACTENDATSTAADAVFNDEVDLSPQDMLALFNSRLQNSSYRINQRFSTPSFPAYGVDGGYASSDQRRYLHKCSACNHWNWPEFNLKFCNLPGLPDNIEDIFEIDDDSINEIDLPNSFVMCEKCQAPLAPDDPREWIALYPNKTHARGYWVTPFSTTRLGLDYLIGQLLKYKKRDYLRGFYNTVLGETYSNSNTQITIEDIEAAFGPANIPDLPTDKGLVIGIDMGQTCHVVIGDDTGLNILLFISIPAERLIEYVTGLFKKYRFVAGGVDRQPYTPTANALRDATNKVILPILYQAGPKSDTRLVDDAYEQLDYVQMNRTRMLDDVARPFRERSIRLYGYSHQKEIVKEHLRDMVRDEKPESPATWLKLTGNDHFFHAIAYYRAALTIRRLINLRESPDLRTMASYSFTVLGKTEEDQRLAGYTKAEVATLAAR